MLLTIMITLVIWQRNRLLDRLLPARFGYLKVFCFGCRGFKHTQCGATLEFDECTHTAINWYFVDCCCCKHLNMLAPGTCVEKQHAADVNIRWFSTWSPHWVCFKPLRPKQQSFMYPNLAAAVFHVSRQTLQQSFTYPNLATAVFHVSKPYQQQPRRRSSSSPNHYFKLWLRNIHYDSVAALDGGLCSEFPTLQTSVVETDTMVV